MHSILTSNSSTFRDAGSRIIQTQTRERGDTVAGKAARACSVLEMPCGFWAVYKHFSDSPLRSQLCPELVDILEHLIVVASARRPKPSWIDEECGRPSIWHRACLESIRNAALQSSGAATNTELVVSSLLSAHSLSSSTKAYLFRFCKLDLTIHSAI